MSDQGRGFSLPEQCLQGHPDESDPACCRCEDNPCRSGRTPSSDECEPLGDLRCILDLDLRAVMQIEAALADRGRETERYMRGLVPDEPPCCETAAARREVLDRQYQGLLERRADIERAAAAVQAAKSAALRGSL